MRTHAHSCALTRTHAHACAGQWSTSCNLTNTDTGTDQHRANASRCCISQPPRKRPTRRSHSLPCERCADNSECCQNDRSYNCTAWAAFGNTPGVLGPSFALSTLRYPFVWMKGVLNGYSSTRVSL